MSPRKTPDVRSLPALSLGQRQVDSFLPSLARGSTPSLLFVGPDGTGKEYTAIDLARRLNCPQPEPCRLDDDPCESCRMAARLEHPGIELIYPTPTQGANEGEDGDVSDIAKVLEEKRANIFARHRFARRASIRVARSRAVIQRASTKPFESLMHVFVFVDAHAMREEAQNALLKVVEEPPPHAVAIFVTTNPEAILPTIRSRCQIVRFSPLKPAVIESILASYLDVDVKSAKRAAKLSLGSITRAIALTESMDDTDRRRAASFVEGITVEPESWAVGSALALSKGANREGVAGFLDEVALVFRDVMTGDPELYVNQDDGKLIDKLAREWPPAKIPTVIERIAEARSGILLGNFNIDSTLAALFLDIHRIR